MSLSTARYEASPRDRAVSFGLALAITIALFAMLVAMGLHDSPGGGAASRLVAFSMPGEKAKSAAKRAPEKTERAKVAPATAAPKVAIAPKIVLPRETKLTLPEGFIQMDRAQMASADIGRAPRAAPPAGSGTGSGGGGGGSGEGEGPGGAKLYNAQWYREPTRAELDGYMPRGAPAGSWATIACRTIANYGVEDCQELAESPPGSGLSRALRQAAWQFKVRPPRLDGKALIGTWVRIRFDWNRSGKREDGAGA